MLRRIAGLATWLLLLRVNVAAVDTTCARHDAAPASAHSPMQEHHGAGDNQHASAPVSEDDCEQPVQADCCREFASCSFTLDLGEVTSEQQLRFALDEQSALGSHLPSSFRSAPEPPPPKA